MSVDTKRAELAVEMVVRGLVHTTRVRGVFSVNSTRDPEAAYQVVNRSLMRGCTCEAAGFGKECIHLLATDLWQRTQDPKMYVAERVKDAEAALNECLALLA